jgi:hypothetical protein
MPLHVLFLSPVATYVLPLYIRSRIEIAFEITVAGQYVLCKENLPLFHFSIQGKITLNRKPHTFCMQFKSFSIPELGLYCIAKQEKHTVEMKAMQYIGISHELNIGKL